MIALVAAYAKAQGMYRVKTTPDPMFTDMLKLELGSVEPSLAGPKRPQDRVALKEVKAGFATSMDKEFGKSSEAQEARARSNAGKNYDLGHGDVVIAAITSCTNTSNPNVMIGAGLLARKAAAKGLTVKPWVKTSLAPGSQVVGEYLDKSGLQKDLDKLGFNLVGFGCTTCIGNSGPLPPENSKAINDNDLVAAAVLSGNRNFEGRVNADVRANYLASPPLVVAYALAGSMNVDIAKEPLGVDQKGKKVFLKDIWPSNKEIGEFVAQEHHQADVRQEICRRVQGRRQLAQDQRQGRHDLRRGTTNRPTCRTRRISRAWEAAGAARGHRRRARAGLLLELDHDRPHLAGRLDQGSNCPAGKYLRRAQGASPTDFNQYGTRRGNHEVMMRGTFANIRIKNQMVPGVEGGVTMHYPSKQRMPIYDAAMKYKAERVPLVVFAGKEYGTGSSRDWAAKGTVLLGVRAVICAVIRAHPPLQSGRHGRHAAGVRGRHVLAVAGPEGR